MELSLSAVRAPSGAGEPLDRGAVPTVSGTLGMGLTKVPPRSLSSEPTCSLLPTPRKSITIVSLAIAQWRTGCRLGRSSVDSPPLLSHLFSSLLLPSILTPPPDHLHQPTPAAAAAAAKSLAPHTPNPCPRVPFLLRHST